MPVVCDANRLQRSWRRGSEHCVGLLALLGSVQKPIRAASARADEAAFSCGQMAAPQVMYVDLTTQLATPFDPSPPPEPTAAGVADGSAQDPQQPRRGHVPRYERIMLRAARVATAMRAGAPPRSERRRRRRQQRRERQRRARSERWSVQVGTSLLQLSPSMKSAGAAPLMLPAGIACQLSRAMPSPSPHSDMVTAPFAAIRSGSLTSNPQRAAALLICLAKQRSLMLRSA